MPPVPVPRWLAQQTDFWVQYANGCDAGVKRWLAKQVPGCVDEWVEEAAVVGPEEGKAGDGKGVDGGLKHGGEGGVWRKWLCGAAALRRNGSAKNLLER